MHGRLIVCLLGIWIARFSVCASLLMNLGLLGLFKYSAFIVENINAFFGVSFMIPQFQLPIGISFYTFQTISYVIDVYRGKTEAQKNPAYYLMYLSMYHQPGKLRVVPLILLLFQKG